MRITYKGVTKDLKYYKGLKWNKPLTPKMKQYESETGKKAIRGGKITGTFEHWLYWRDIKKQPKIKPKIKPTKIHKTEDIKYIGSGSGYKKISERKEVVDGIKVDIIRVRCNCCNSIIDYYYPGDRYSIPTLLKTEIIKDEYHKNKNKK